MCQSTISNIADAARDVEPVMRQVFIASTVTDQNVFERKCFVIRKRIEHAVRALNLNDKAAFYVPSFSAAQLFTKACCLRMKWEFIIRI